MSYFDFDETKQKSKGGVAEKYPFSKLEVGQSFQWGDETNVFNMRASAYQRGVKLGRKFKVSAKTRTVERVA